MNVKRLNKISFFLITTFLILLSTTTPSLAGHRNYFIKASLDYSTFGIMTEVIKDDGEGDYLEEKGGYTYSSVKDYANICKGNAPDIIKTDTSYLKINFAVQRPETYDEKFITDIYEPLKKISENDPLVFSFPGIRDAGSRGGYEATSSDYIQATKVAETLTTGLNQAIIFIRNNTGDSIVSNRSLHLMLGRLSYVNKMTNKSGVKSFQILVGGNGKASSFTITRATSSDSKNLIPISGLDYDDYVKITHNKSGTFSYFPFKMEKGYYPGDALYENIPAKYQENVVGNENEYITWGHLILQAMLNNDIEGVSEQDFAVDMQTIIGQGLGSDLSRTISSVRMSLGLSTMSELVLNMGARPANYHYGVMTKSMHNISLTIYTLNLVIALLFVGFMIVKMIHQKMLATTNIVAKTTLMEGIKDLLFVAIMLGFFAPLFEMLLELNYLIVRTFSYSSNYMTSFNVISSQSLSMESMAGFIISSMFLSIDMYINFVYLVRELVVSFFFAVAPIMIVSYLWSPNQKNLVFGYIKELVGNIFMQSFHAITMTFFAGFSTENMTSLQALASAYCFIPITQFFRQLVLGNSGGFSDKIGGKLAGQMTTTMMGMQSAQLQARQSKEMFTAQQKANYDMKKAEFDGQMKASTYEAVGKTLNTGASALGQVAGSFTDKIPFVGDKAGAIAEGIGKVTGQAIESGLTVYGINKGAETTLEGTKMAQQELGQVNAKQANETLGMGLAELGVGLGVSSFDSAGDRMVNEGVSNIQKGARGLGQSESMMGEGAEYMGEAASLEQKTRGYSHAISHGASNLQRGVLEIVDKGKKEREKEEARELEIKNFHEVTTKVASLSALDNTIKTEYIDKFSQGNNKSIATAHSRINSEDFRNPDEYKHLKEAQAGTSEAKLHSLISAYESGDKAKLKEAMEGTIVKDISVNHNTGNYDFVIDAVKAGLRAQEGINMEKGIIETNNLYVDNTGGHRGI